MKSHDVSFVIFRDFLCEHVIQLQDIDVYRPIALSWIFFSVIFLKASFMAFEGAEIDGALRGQVRDSQGGSWFVVMFLWHGCHMLPYYLWDNKMWTLKLLGLCSLALLWSRLDPQTSWSEKEPPPGPWTPWRALCIVFCFSKPPSLYPCHGANVANDHADHVAVFYFDGCSPWRKHSKLGSQRSHRKHQGERGGFSSDSGRLLCIDASFQSLGRFAEFLPRWESEGSERSQWWGWSTSLGGKWVPSDWRVHGTYGTLGSTSVTRTSWTSQTNWTPSGSWWSWWSQHRLVRLVVGASVIASCNGASFGLVGIFPIFRIQELHGFSGEWSGWNWWSGYALWQSCTLQRSWRTLLFMQRLACGSCRCQPWRDASCVAAHLCGRCERGGCLGWNTSPHGRTSW